MVPVKRKLMVVSGAIAAVLALPGCAPAGYNAADYSGAPVAEPAGNEVDTTAPPADPGAESGDESENGDKSENDESENGDESTEEKETPDTSDEELTTKLRGSKVPRMGEVVKDQDGRVLYRFDDDTADPSKSNCNGDCAKVWPPALTDGNPELDGVSSSVVGTVERADGTKQITIDGWPVYRYIGDKKPGQWKGQNVGGKWFVIKPNGKKNLTCLPKVSKPVAPPADDSDSKPKSKDSDSGGDYKY